MLASTLSKRTCIFCERKSKDFIKLSFHNVTTDKNGLEYLNVFWKKIAYFVIVYFDIAYFVRDKINMSRS